MQRSPTRKNTRSQVSVSQDGGSSTPTKKKAVSQGTQPVLTQQICTSVATATTSAAANAPRETFLTASSQNVFETPNVPPQSLPPLVPGPSVSFEQPLAPPSSNASIDMESLQRQIDLLQAQLNNAQRAFKAAESRNTVVIGQSMPPQVSSIPITTNNNFVPEATVDRRNPTPCSSMSNGVTVSPSYLGQQNYLTSQPSTSSAQMQRKIYDLPEFNGAPEDWPMFLSAFEHSTSAYLYSNFENCLRLQKALKGEARECVKSLLIHPNNVPTAIEQLRLQYGRPDTLIRYQLQQIREIQPIGENAVEKLVPFSIKVRNLAAFLETANGQQHLSNPTLMEELVQKLPMSRRLDWAQYASTLNQWPTVMDFSTWLQRVANLVRSIQVPNLSKSRSSGESKRKVVLHAADRKENQIKCNFCLEPHKIFDCKKFLKLSVPNRWSEVKRLRLCFSCLEGGHSSRFCRRRKQCSIEDCLQKHNKLLHEQKNNGDGSMQVPESESVLSCMSSKSDKSVLLFRVVPVVLYGPSNKIETYALLDEGSSVTMVDSSLVKHLGLQGQQSKLNLNWYAGKASQEMATVVNLHISGNGKQRKYALKNVYGVSNLKLPAQSFNMDLSNHPGLPIKSYDDVVPRVLIGLDHCHLGLPDEIVPLKENGPYAANTPLGWVVFGPMMGKSPNLNMCLLSVQPDQELHELMANYFETENFGVKLLPVIESEEDLRARRIMKETTIKVEGRFQTRLLWRSDDVELPESYPMALRRLIGIERKMKKNFEFGVAYKAIMKDYVSKGYARKLLPHDAFESHPRTWYLPHFGVVNPNKPGKIRLVFDAAASVEGISLNSKLLKGPQQYKPLPSVLFNFRIGAVAVCGDIKEMFHQVLVAPEDRGSQRFLWREDDSKPPDVYEMLVMTFGAACSPCIAQYIKDTNAQSYTDQYPRAVKSILDHHYVDDYVDSFPTAAKAIEVTEQVRAIHKAAGFELRNFSSNSLEVASALKGTLEKQVNFSGDLNELQCEKVLGMYWHPKDDAFKFNLKFHNVKSEVIEGRRCPTKRELLSVVMSVFDPLGFLSNFMITAKLLMREVWRHDIRWDDTLPDEISKIWSTWRQELENVVGISIPRYYFQNGVPRCLELHVFVDASEDAFGAVSYWRSINTDGEVEVSFAAAKSRCAPLKAMSIPRLELQAAVLGTRLMTTILKEHSVRVSRTICWSDSTTVIGWIGSESRRYKPFVAHRITEILESTCPENWRWLPTKVNVADETTRMKTQTELSNDSRWFKGPQFLYCDESQWPEAGQVIRKSQETEELRPKFALVVTHLPFIDLYRFSSFLKLKRTVAWVLRFINRCQKKSGPNDKKCLTVTELKDAEICLCRLAQRESFSAEIEIIENEGILPKGSELYTLSPYFDDNSLLRVNGRVDAASWLPLEVRRPVILPPYHRFTELFVAHVHDKMRHQNFEATIGEIRRSFWIPRIRRALRKCISNCYTCRFRRTVPVQPFMGSLPKDRLTPYVRPFTYTGLDYFGPITVTIGRRHEKRWVALFTCLTIRAIHLEIAFDLSTDACILAIRNFINRRGVPTRLRSDNGKNFVGVEQVAKRFDEVFDVARVQDELSTKGIDWQFNCPHNPAEGGAWERMVQCVKRVLQATLKESSPREHTLQSFLIEAENIVNSRPLTHLPLTNEDEEPLTPNHFLLGSPNTAQTPAEAVSDKPIALKKQWRISRQLRDHFWSRWIKEYLPTLTRRSKWCQRTKPIAIGDLVLICDSNVSRKDWKRGRVVAIYKGRDGIIRGADIRTSSGVLKRPVSKLAVLDLE